MLRIQVLNFDHKYSIIKSYNDFEDILLTEDRFSFYYKGKSLIQQLNRNSGNCYVAVAHIPKEVRDKYNWTLDQNGLYNPSDYNEEQFRHLIETSMRFWGVTYG